MLRLGSISLVQFRNYLESTFSFKEKIVGICGMNGTGKTNLLDAIYYLSFSRSYFSRPDSQNVYHGMAGMRLAGSFELNREKQELVCILRENNRKELILNEKAYRKLSDHIGKFPCVMIAPDDVVIITGGSEERRNGIDSLLSQIEKPYLLNLIDHNRILQQRNGLLKLAAESGKHDESLLQILDTQLIAKGNSLFEKRKKFLKTYLPLVTSLYERIAGGKDGLHIRYESQLLQTDFAGLLKTNRQRDFALQRTTGGIHRDDLVFSMGNAPFKNEASQGQRKSLLFALKLAEWQTLKEQKGFTPILLLDDVFEKLDEKRMYQLLHWVCTESDGQVFITDTHAYRLQEHLEEMEVAYQMIQL